MADEGHTFSGPPQAKAPFEVDDGGGIPILPFLAIVAGLCFAAAVGEQFKPVSYVKTEFARQVGAEVIPQQSHIAPAESRSMEWSNLTTIIHNSLRGRGICRVNMTVVAEVNSSRVTVDYVDLICPMMLRNENANR